MENLHTFADRLDAGVYGFDGGREFSDYICLFFGGVWTLGTLRDALVDGTELGIVLLHEYAGGVGGGVFCTFPAALFYPEVEGFAVDAEHFCYLLLGKIGLEEDFECLFLFVCVFHGF